MPIDFLQLAIDLARRGMHANAGGPFGAVVVQDGVIVGQGWNQVTSTNDPTAHAEIVAIRDASRALDTYILSECEIYSSCEPCPMCLAAIYWARIQRLCYAASGSDAAAIGFDDELIRREIQLPAHERQMPCIQRSSEAALALFREWSAKPDRLSY